QLPEISMYWNQRTRQNIIAKVFTRERFQQLLSYWHLNDNSTAVSADDDAKADGSDDSDAEDSCDFVNGKDVTDVVDQVNNQEVVDIVHDRERTNNEMDVNCDNYVNNGRFHKLHPLMMTLLTTFRTIYTLGELVMVIEQKQVLMDAEKVALQ